MSDFTSNFWSLFIAAATLVSILACLVLLWFSGRIKAHTSSDNTTGHVWDGDLRELNNPLPRWWVGLFLITVVFALVYLALYPGLGAYPGQLAWTAVGQHQSELDKGNAAAQPLYAKFLATPAPELAKDARAMSMAERLFQNHCAQCHGSDARGTKDIPNLTDKDWLYGGTPDLIKETISKGRIGNMPPMAAAVGSADDVKNVAQYVLSLSGSPHDSVRAALGKPKFGVCAACHGIDGKGNQIIGAANLTDEVWLHGYGEPAIVAMINAGKLNQMPSHGGKLNEAQIHLLASYVWGFANKGDAATQ